jgi:hypothetical protein
MNKRHALSQLMPMIYGRHLQVEYICIIAKTNFQLQILLYVTGDNNGIAL